MKQEVSIIWGRYWKKRNHYFRIRGHYLVVFCKKLVFQAPALLSSFDGDGDFVAFYHSVSHSEIKYKAFRGKDSVPYKYICLKTINLVEFIFEQGINLLAFQVFT